MKVINRDTYTEMHPETVSDLEYLKQTYPHCFPCLYVCVAETRDIRLPNLNERFQMERSKRHGVSTFQQ